VVEAAARSFPSELIHSPLFRKSWRDRFRMLGFYWSGLASDSGRVFQRWPALCALAGPSGEGPLPRSVFSALVRSVDDRCVSQPMCLVTHAVQDGLVLDCDTGYVTERRHLPPSSTAQPGFHQRSFQRDPENLGVRHIVETPPRLITLSTFGVGTRRRCFSSKDPLIRLSDLIQGTLLSQPSRRQSPRCRLVLSASQSALTW
jgi:hypothetical protein